jgi:hypothetical protein
MGAAEFNSRREIDTGGYMSQFRCLRVLVMFAFLVGTATLSARAEEIKTVFVIAMENHNWTQPANQFTGNINRSIKIRMHPSSTVL